MADLDDDDILDGEIEDEPEPAVRPTASKAWRSIERYREMKELKKHLDDFFIDAPEANQRDLHG